MKLGYDYYELECYDIVYWLRRFKNKQITIINLKQVKNDVYRFYIPIYQRHKIKEFPLVFIKSVGLIHYLLIMFKPNNILVIITSIIMIMFLNTRINKIEVIGNNPSFNQTLKKYLDDNDVKVMNSLLNYQQINQLYNRVKDKYLDKVNYLNIYQEGTNFIVEYTPVKKNHTTSLSYRSIVASRAGIITRIDVSQGNVMVQENDYVNKGDVLVSNTIISTNDKTKIIATEGNVYAYCVEDYTCTLPTNNKDDEVFARMLLNIRSRIPKDSVIDREIVLKYGINKDKVELKMRYIFITNIATREK